MMRSMAAVLAGCLLLPSPATAQTNKAKLTLLADVTAVAPGAEFELGIRFDIEQDWHIYWKNPGDAGLPPSFEWTLPEGFTIGDIRFPVPHRHEAADLVTNILEGSPMLTAKVKAPAQLPSGGVTVKTAAKWLICKEMCLLEQQEASLTLPVAATTADVKPANAEQFESAHFAQPTASEKAKYLKLHVTGPEKPAKIGDTIEVQLVLELQAGCHIQSDKPSLPGLIATDVFVERTAGVMAGKPTYPAPKVRNVPEIGRLSEFVGQTVIRLPVAITEEAQGPELPLAGVLVYQACEERTGVCYPPEHVAWSASVRLAP